MERLYKHASQHKRNASPVTSYFIAARPYSSNTAALIYTGGDQDVLSWVRVNTDDSGGCLRRR